MNKRKWLCLLVLVAFAIGGCTWLQTTKKMEVITIGYESLATVGFPTVLAYLQQRELNGSLIGEELAKAKSIYAQARSKFIQAGDVLQGSILNPSPANLATYQAILREVAILLANLSGGKVEGNQLIVPKVEVQK